MKKNYVYEDFFEAVKCIGKIQNTNITGPVDFEVKVFTTRYKCSLYHERPNGWYISINNDEHLLDLAFPTDTYWNARQIYEYTQDADAACAISGAINEIYISIKDILE